MLNWDEHKVENVRSRIKSDGLIPVHCLHVPVVVSVTLTPQRRRNINICSGIMGRLCLHVESKAVICFLDLYIKQKENWVFFILIPKNKNKNKKNLKSNVEVCLLDSCESTQQNVPHLFHRSVRRILHLQLLLNTGAMQISRPACHSSSLGYKPDDTHLPEGRAAPLSCVCVYVCAHLTGDLKSECTSIKKNTVSVLKASISFY